MVDFTKIVSCFALGVVLGLGLALVLQTLLGGAFWIPYAGLAAGLGAFLLFWGIGSWDERLGLFLMLLGGEGVAFLPALVVNYFFLTRQSTEGVILSGVLLYYSVAVALIGVGLLVVGSMLVRLGAKKQF
ncbi:MAG TPA: hypothetical protein VGQ00_04475 [Candidatus Norongarragalinales archaeon]|jgi:hypothetical protein|nr:hypothetical protein [Candidatus Norongarragalinales archaeon]